MYCDCIWCRRKEFKSDFALFIYSEILNDISIYLNLKEYNVKEGSLTSNDLGGYMNCIRYNIDDALSIFLNENDKDNIKYIKYLKKHKLWDTLMNAVNEYHKNIIEKEE